MMEIEVGEYVRTKDGIVDIVILPYKGKCANPNCNDKHISCKANYYREDEIANHNKDITKIIEEGDFVNGFPVMEPVYNGNVWFGVDEGYEHFKKAFGDIKTILTHEQYEQNAYRLEESNG